MQSIYKSSPVTDDEEHGAVHVVSKQEEPDVKHESASSINELLRKSSILDLTVEEPPSQAASTVLKLEPVKTETKAERSIETDQ